MKMLPIVAASVFCLVVAISSNVLGQQKISYIVFYKPYTDSLETNIYRSDPIKVDFKERYENVKNVDVQKDINFAILHKDYRFISISGNSYLYPGLEGGYKKHNDGTKTFNFLTKKNGKYVDEYKFKVIYGTSDVLNGNEPDLQGVAYDYAKKYNKLLLIRIRALKDKAKN